MKHHSRREFLLGGLGLLLTSCSSPHYVPLNGLADQTRLLYTHIPFFSSGRIVSDDANLRFIERPAARHIYTSKLDGSDAQRITDGFASAPVWSPDGKQIAYVATDDLAYAPLEINISKRLPSAVTLVDLVSKQKTILGACGATAHLAFSPDGNSLVCSRFTIDSLKNSPEESSIVLITLNKRKERVLLEYGTIAEVDIEHSPTPEYYDTMSQLVPQSKWSLWPLSPKWSPNGKLLLYGTDLQDVTSGAQCSLYHNRPMLGTQWIDDTHICYNSQQAISIGDLTGVVATAFTNLGENPDYPTRDIVKVPDGRTIWYLLVSPDGTQAAYWTSNQQATRKRSDFEINDPPAVRQQTLECVDLRTAATRRLAHWITTGNYSVECSWSPDSKFIFYQVRGEYYPLRVGDNKHKSYACRGIIRYDGEMASYRETKHKENMDSVESGYAWSPVVR